MKSYVSQLTDNELEEFLFANGYSLCKDLTSNDGETLPAIQRDEQSIFVRAQRVPENAETNAIQNTNKSVESVLKMYLLISAISGEYSQQIDLINIEDFFLSKICVSQIPEEQQESERLCIAYLKMMAKKFPTYTADFNAYCDKLRAEIAEEDNTL